MIIENDIMVFNTDDEITDFFLSQTPTAFYSDKSQHWYYDYDYTDAYRDALEKKYKFKVLEQGSKVMKRKCLTRGVISKPIDNICTRM